MDEKRDRPARPPEPPPRDEVDEAVEESFPASDPPSSQPLHSGTPKEKGPEDGTGRKAES